MYDLVKDDAKISDGSRHNPLERECTIGFSVHPTPNSIIVWA